MRTEADVGSGWRAALLAAVLLAGAAVVHCSSTPANGTGSDCTCADGSACPSGDSARCEGGDAGSTVDAGADDTGDASADFPLDGPYCVSYEIEEEFYAAFTPQCTCLDQWKQLSDVQIYIEELDYYPGVYSNAHLVPTCPQLDCCVRQVGDGGPFPSGCRCSAATLDCENDVNNGASSATSCP